MTSLDRALSTGDGCFGVVKPRMGDEMARYLMTRKGDLRASRQDLGRLAIIAATAVVTAMAIAPLVAWYVLGSLSDARLSRVSDIGQAYGSFAAIISAIALCAASGAVLLQLKQNKETKLRQWQEAHAEVFDMVLQSPDLYGPCVVDMKSFESREEMQRYLFTTKYLIYARVGMEIDNIPEKAMREEICAEMFASPVARKLWRRRRDWIISTFGGLGYFNSVVEEEYKKAVAALATPPSGDQEDLTESAAENSRREAN